jgi:hypothetical protein
MPTETIYEDPAHEAAFYLPSAGFVRFAFSNPRASGYIRSPNGSMTRVEPGRRLLLPPGQHILALHDPKLVARVSIMFAAD